MPMNLALALILASYLIRSVVEKVMEKLPAEERNVIEAAKKERLSLVKDVAGDMGKIGI